MNGLTAVDYTNNNHPVSTLSEAVQQMAGMSLFCKLDYSHFYHCLQMADQRSVGMLAFKFDIRNFAYEVTADLCLLSQVSCAGTWTHSSRLTNVLETWTLLELQPTMPRTLSRTYGESFNAFTEQD